MIDFTDIPEDLRERMAAEGSNVLVLSQPVGNDENGRPRPVCRKCLSTEKVFSRKGAAMTVSQTLDVPEHYDFATDTLGGLQAPAVVVIDDHQNVIDAWTDLRPSHIDNALKQLAAQRNAIPA